MERKSPEEMLAALREKAEAARRRWIMLYRRRRNLAVHNINAMREALSAEAGAKKTYDDLHAEALKASKRIHSQ
jgi:hypothetical protein